MKRRTFIGISGAALGCLALESFTAQNGLAAQAARPATMPKGPDPAFVPLPSASLAQGRRALPLPDRMGGASLMQCLAQRRSSRRFSALEVTDNILANLLWATWGINRPGGQRTAPSAQNRQQADLYVALASGVWLYHAKENQLELQNPADVRKGLGQAALALIYTATEDNYGAMLVGSMFQNAGLFCASTGLGNVVRASNVKEAAKHIKITPGYKIWVTQAIGWPA